MHPKEYLELPDKIIREHIWDRALISFSYEKGNQRKHIGTGFIYTPDIKNNVFFIVTATHVIKEMEKYDNFSYVIFQVTKEGHYVKVPFINFKFINFDNRDISFSLIMIENIIMSAKYQIPNIIPSMISFFYRKDIDTYEDYINGKLIFGYTGSENTVSLNYRNYSFFWRNILLKDTPYIVNKYTSIINPIGLEFNNRNMIELSENLDLSNSQVTGNFPKLVGMSGGPCIYPKISPKDEFVFNNVIGVIVEQLNKPPHNGNVVVVSPIKPILLEMEHIILQIKKDPNNIKLYLR